LNAPAPPPAVAVVLHDVARARWRDCRTLMRDAAAAARAAGVDFLPLTLLVVPQLHGRPNPPRFAHWLYLQSQRGHELVLHGWQHRDDAPPPRSAPDWWRRRVLTDREGEFAALDEAAARRNLEHGLAWMREMRLPVRGFVAPAWRMNAATWRALEAMAAFDHCSTRLDVRARRQARAPLLRIELHPGDSAHAALRALWMRTLTRALGAQRRQPLRVGQVAARLRDRPPAGIDLAVAPQRPLDTFERNTQ
jgi:peptidoglycan/xylan/chitin deacetylase (PgdA/CDA1 family)